MSLSRRKTSLIICLGFSYLLSVAQQPSIERIEPPFWWIGMNESNLELLFYGKNLGDFKAYSSVPGLEIINTISIENPNYLFVYIKMDSNLKEGVYPLLLKGDKDKEISVLYRFDKREPGSASRKGFGWGDNIYLLMPDRFANGNPSNDDIDAMVEKADRNNPNGRHGGDLAGVAKYLDYLKELGMTAVWLNPIFENNQPHYSYHGYAITDLYNVDPRLGSNEEFVRVVKQAHQKGLKIIMDMVFNHLGDQHWMIRDLPSSSFIHRWPEYTPSNFRSTTIPDPYHSEYDYQKMINGWFDRHMPDLNQNDSLLADYLIQNSIWWIEYSGIDAIRMDTYQYADKDFMARWVNRIKGEYPDFSIVGELWVEQKALHAYWMEGNYRFGNYDSPLQFLTDFPLYIALRESFLDKEKGWEKGVERIYYCLAQDFVYDEPRNNMIFIDNHDLSRFYSIAGENLQKFTLGLVMLYTLRGIPQFTYGTEQLMTGLESDGHGLIRGDMMGGWPNDPVNAFEAKGRNKQQQKAWELISSLANWRKSSNVIHSGNTRHFLPENNVYSYFRYNENDTVWVILNYGDEEALVETGRFAEMLGQHRRGHEIVSNREISWGETLTLQPYQALIIELIP
ncbi:MAG TPA: glycoside hydrolase family 13 protein [Bacteroidales bacterium]|jgi:glycosidase|nr:glycoside hydrolase family 13 protein [Bacteroidales bacterium]